VDTSGACSERRHRAGTGRRPDCGVALTQTPR
jgi:hypothetical protein